MVDRTILAQRRLRRFRVYWGPQVLRHEALVPVFDGSYKVFGLIALDAEAPPTWYPGAPLTVERRLLLFRSSLSEAPPRWRDVPPELLQACFYFDPWGAIETLLPAVAGAPSMAQATNLAASRIHGERVADVLFEPTLHRVRALMLRRGWGLAHRVEVLRLPPLRQIARRADPPPWAGAAAALSQAGMGAGTPQAGPAAGAPQASLAAGAPPEQPQGWFARAARTKRRSRPPRRRR
jgi:hypothetical protein